MELRTGMVPLTTIQLDSTDAEVLDQELQRRKNEAPALFNGLPSLLSLADYDEESLPAEQLTALVECLRQHGLAVIGVRSCPAHLQPACQQLALADFGKQSAGRSRKAAVEEPANNANSTEAASDSETANAETSEANAAELPVASTTRVHQGNVRSGQQLYFDGDLFIIGMVSAGAEVLATGHIHVLGALRGKALAGVKGSPDATISCSRFDAQLVAIAGQYQLFENEHALMNQSVLVSLEDDQLVIRGAEK